MSDCDIFVSYAHEDRERIQPFVHALETQGWSVFWDRTLPPGESWRSYIGTRLASAPVVIVAWSEHSIESEWVAQEAERAIARRALIPVLIDKVIPPLGLSHIHAADLVDWLKDGTRPLPAPLQRAIAARVPKPAVAPPAPVALPEPVPPARAAVAESASVAPPSPAAPASAAGLSGLARTGVPLPVFALLALAVGGWVAYDHLSGSSAPPPPKECAFAGTIIRHGVSVTAYLNSTAPHGQTCRSEQRTCTNGALSGTFDHNSCTIAASPPAPPSPPKNCTFAGATVRHGDSVQAYYLAIAPPGGSCARESRHCSDGTLSGSYTAAFCTFSSAAPPASQAKNCTFVGTTVVHGASITAYRDATAAYGRYCLSEQCACSDGMLSGSYEHTSCVVPQPSKDCPFAGATIRNGDSVQAYRVATAQPGGCARETRHCRDGTLSGSFAFALCTYTTPPAGNDRDRGVQAAVRWGLIGNWASYVCGAPATATQPIIRFAIHGNTLVREVDSGSGVERSNLSEIGLRADGYLEYIMGPGVRVVVVAKGVDGRIRVHSSRSVGGGYNVVQVENGRLANGAESPWLVRCN